MVLGAMGLVGRADRHGDTHDRRRLDGAVSGIQHTLSISLFGRSVRRVERFMTHSSRRIGEWAVQWCFKPGTGRGILGSSTVEFIPTVHFSCSRMWRSWVGLAGNLLVLHCCLAL